MRYQHSTPRRARRTGLTRALVVALAGVVGLATPALAADDLEGIRDRIDRVEREQQRADADRRSAEETARGLGEELQTTTAALQDADQRLRETTERVEQARVTQQEAELDLQDAETRARRIEADLSVARADESRIETRISDNADAQEQSRVAVGAIARESYKQGGMGSFATTVELLSGEADAVDQMSMARTVLRVQDQQIRRLATQEAEQVAEQDLLAGVRRDIAYLLAQAEATVVAMDEAHRAAAAATTELAALEVERAQARDALDAEEARVQQELAAQQARSEDLADELAELASTRHGLATQEQAELARIEEARRQAEEEARRRAQEEAARRAAEEAARQAAAEEAARQRAAEREAQRQQEAAAQAARRADAAAAAEAQRRAEAAAADADAARRAAEEARRSQEAAEADRAAQVVAPPPPAAPVTPAAPAGYLSTPTSGPVSSEFGMRTHPVLGVPLLHSGIDYAPSCGTPVVAAADGVVYTVSSDGSRGNYLVLDHGVQRGVNLTTTYMHFQDRAVVGSGQSVSRGQLVGHVGNTGTSTGCHLHFETRENGAPVNPRTWL